MSDEVVSEPPWPGPDQYEYEQILRRRAMDQFKQAWANLGSEIHGALLPVLNGFVEAARTLYPHLVRAGLINEKEAPVPANASDSHGRVKMKFPNDARTRRQYPTSKAIGKQKRSDYKLVR